MSFKHVPFPERNRPSIPFSEARTKINLPLDALLPSSHSSLETILSHAAGKTVCLESGIISLDNPVVLQGISDVVLQGSDDEDHPTTIRYSRNGFQLRKCSNVVLANLCLEGPHPYAVEATGIAVRSSTSVFVYRCDVSSFARALVEFAESNGIVTESRFSESAMIDYRLPYAQKKPSLSKLETKKNMGYGISVNNGSHVRVTQSSFFHCRHAIASGNDRKQEYYTSYLFKDNFVDGCGVLPDPDNVEGDGYVHSAASVDTHEVHYGPFSIVGNTIIGRGKTIGINIRGGTGIVEGNNIKDCSDGIRVGPAVSHKELYRQQRVVVGQNEFLRVTKEVVFTTDYLSHFPK